MRPSRGFSLVELMVAITLALIVTGAVLSVFVATRSASQSTAGTAALTDGGRFALDFIQFAVRDAGYMACNTARRQTSILNGGATPLYYSFTEPLGGFEADGTAPGGAYSAAVGSATTPVVADGSAGDWVSGLDPALTAPPLVIKGNDVLVVRSSLRNTQPVFVTAIVDGAANFTVNNAGGLAANELAVISDCAKSVVFQIQQVAPPSGQNASIALSTGGPAPGNIAANFLPLSFSTGSQVTAVDTVVFYIGAGADGDSALYAADLYDSSGNFTGAFNAKELVPDIEAMQVLYGLDTSGTQSVGGYVTADQVPDFNSIMSVQVAVLAASLPGAVKAPSVAPTFNLLGTAVTAPIDTRARHVFEVTTAVRNALP